MIRKIGKVGQSSLTVTLPKKFVIANNLKKGDEISAVIKENLLEIYPLEKTFEKEKKINIDISGFKDKLIWRYVFGAYKKGFTTIIIKYDKDEIETTGRLKHLGKIKINTLLENIANNTIGMEILSSLKGSIILKDITQVTEKEMIPTLRRIIYLLKQMIIDLEESDFENASKKDEIINKLSNYCIRIINITQKDFELLRLIELLEQLGDSIKGLRDTKAISLLINVSENLDISNKSFNGFIKGDLIRYFSNIDKLSELPLIKENLREIGQSLIEINLKPSN